MSQTLKSTRVRYLLLCLLMLPASVLPAKPVPEKVLTEVTLAQLRSVSSAKIAPDGALIAYTLSVPRPVYADEDGAAWSELHVVDQGGQSRPFITGKVNIGSLAWTPNGKGISFLAKRGSDEHKALYIIPADGGEAYKVLEYDTDISRYAWSPDGRRVAFTAKPQPDETMTKDKDHGFNAEIYEEDYLMTRVWIGPVSRENPGPQPDEAAKPRMLPLTGSTQHRIQTRGRHRRTAA